MRARILEIREPKQDCSALERYFGLTNFYLCNFCGKWKSYLDFRVVKVNHDNKCCDCEIDEIN